MLDRIVVVLVQPQHPGNVGAAARAMKNMGLSRLVLVDPPTYDPEQARWMAPGCADVLASARIVADLDQALEGCHVAVASTARHRKQGQPVIDPNQLAVQIADDSRTWALLFGREDFGLSTEDIRRCESIVRIPTPEHASLNLGQAVLLIANTLFAEARHRGAAASGRTLGGSRGRSTTASKSKADRYDAPAELPRLEPAVADLVDLLDRVGYFRSTPRPNVQLTARLALTRAQLSIRHLEALRGMVNRTRWALDNPGLDPRAPRSDSTDPSDTA